MNFIEELRWRGMIHDMTPEIEDLFKSGEMVTAYVGIDPTADSLHIGHLVSVMMLKHLQLSGHKPLLYIPLHCSQYKRSGLQQNSRSAARPT